MKSTAPIQVHIDADTGNEVDDGYAIFRALVAPELKVIGVSSAGFGLPSNFGNGTEKSQQVNEEILGRLGLKNTVPHPRGALNAMRDIFTPVDSPAARSITAKALGMPLGSKLRVYVLGSFTNIASAVLLEPRLNEKVSIYLIGPTYRDGKLLADDSNSQADIHAWEALEKTPVELHIMPANTLLETRRFDFAFNGVDPPRPLYENRRLDFIFVKTDLDRYFRSSGGVRDFLAMRWDRVSKHVLENAPEFMARYSQIVRVAAGEWLMWDVALIEASLHPEWTQVAWVSTAGRQARIYSDVDKLAMERDFWYATKADPVNYPSR